jgi:deoxyribodipyrimidine photolyase-related protein
MVSPYHTLRLILGDQLNREHTWYKSSGAGVLYVMMEVLSETNYVRHHIQKIVGFFLSMRAFGAELEAAGFSLRYIHLDEEGNQQAISGNIHRLLAEHGIGRFEYQLPDEYRLDEELKGLCASLSIPWQAYDSEHFLSPREGVADLFSGKKSYLLEHFYRRIRKRYHLLMEADGESPLGGRWNFDQENRKKLPRGIKLPAPLHFAHDATAIIAILEAKGVETIGAIEPQAFNWPISRAECLELLRHFIQHQLPQFGTYQDAMSEGDYLLFHSKLSFAMNTKMLHPLEVVQGCIAHWQENQGAISIAQIEGFVRQIIGWREYMRGVYWAKMPEYAGLNYFGHQAKLPAWYWTGQTKMNCLKHAIGQSLEHAYAHHIQRLMVTGNFALLLGVHPDEVDDWYLGIYMDAIEWVEITNTRGMSQFADGGIVGTKPYVSSANYIHKMGDYCGNCHYRHQEKLGPRACPFNSLYWDFYDRHADKLAHNPRIGMMYRLWDKMEGAQKAAILEQAAHLKARVEDL